MTDIRPPAAALSVLSALRDAGHEAWFVGGCVRDRLLGRSVNDWDVATEAEPTAVIELFPRAIATGLAHGTVTVVVDRLPVEVTTYRVEVGHSDGRRPDAVHFTRDLREDLGRRDFTVNAMAWDPLSDTLVDPYGGQDDLAKRMLRAVGDPIERFTEDGLRPLRAVRFATVLDLLIDPPTLAAIPQTAATFRKVSAERVRVELVKTLASPRAAWGMALLRDCGLLAECWPELASLDERTWTRTLTALDSAPPDPVVRLAVLFHATGGEAVPALKRLRFSNLEVKQVAHLHAFRDLQPAASRADGEVRRMVAAIGRDALDPLVAYRRTWESDADWSVFEARVAETGARAAPHAPRELAISGRDVMTVTGIPPSRRVGRILEALLERVWVDPALNTPEALRALVVQVESEVPEK